MSMYVCICQGMYLSMCAHAYDNKSEHPQYHKAPPTPSWLNMFEHEGLFFHSLY